MYFSSPDIELLHCSYAAWTEVKVTNFPKVKMQHIKSMVACEDRHGLLPVPECSGENVGGPKLQDVLCLYSHLYRI